MLNAPIGSLRCTSCGVGQATAPNRSTMYVPIRPAKNMISVDRNSHRHVLPLGIGKRGLVLELRWRRMGHDRSMGQVSGVQDSEVQ